MLVNPKCFPVKYSQNTPGIILSDELLKVAVNIETGKPDLRLIGLIAYFWRKTAASNKLNQRFQHTYDLIETDLGLSPYQVRKFSDWMGAAGLLIRWPVRQITGAKLICCYELQYQVLNPLIDGRVPWPDAKVVEEYKRRLDTYKETGKDNQAIRYIALKDYAVARMYERTRPESYVQRRNRKSDLWFEALPTAAPLRTASGEYLVESWPIRTKISPVKVQTQSIEEVYGD